MLADGFSRAFTRFAVPIMYKIANRSLKELEELFRGTASKTRFNEAIVEKDFWVCLMLDNLFHRNSYKDAFTFKGGTSLSKAWNIIERFSEDIDLVLDWRTLGYAKDEPNDVRSKNKQDKLNKEANAKAAEFIGGELLDSLRRDFSGILHHEYMFAVDESDPQTILFHYPRIFHSDGLQQTVRLEIGPLAAWVPAEMTEIVPYSAEKYPQVFEHRETLVRTATAERTFWEKLTILHMVAHFPEGKVFPARYSRHYYDVFCYCKNGYKHRVFEHKDLLENVAQFKEKFYPSSVAQYELARIGSLKLVPPGHILRDLERDYSNMREMIYGDIPDFDEVLECVSCLEKEINALG